LTLHADLFYDVSAMQIGTYGEVVVIQHVIEHQKRRNMIPLNLDTYQRLKMHSDYISEMQPNVRQR
jgi:hypothetical protein